MRHGVRDPAVTCQCGNIRAFLILLRIVLCKIENKRCSESLHAKGDRYSLSKARVVSCISKAKANAAKAAADTAKTSSVHCSRKKTLSHALSPPDPPHPHHIYPGHADGKNNDEFAQYPFNNAVSRGSFSALWFILSGSCCVAHARAHPRSTDFAPQSCFRSVTPHMRQGNRRNAVCPPHCQPYVRSTQAPTQRRSMPTALVGQVTHKPAAAATVSRHVPMAKAPTPAGDMPSAMHHTRCSALSLPRTHRTQ